MRRAAVIGGILAAVLVTGAGPAVAAPPDCVLPAPLPVAALGGLAAVPPPVPAPEPSCVAAPEPEPGRPAGYDTSAAAVHGWGEPARSEEFDGAALGEEWNVYDGPGHAGKGRRTPDAVSLRDGVMTVTGDSRGATAGMP